MPELPEVETIARGLAKRVTGDVIESVWLGQKKEPLKSPAHEIAAALDHSRIVSVHRMGKHIVLDLQRQAELPSTSSGQSAPVNGGKKRQNGNVDKAASAKTASAKTASAKTASAKTASAKAASAKTASAKAASAKIDKHIHHPAGAARSVGATKAQWIVHLGMTGRLQVCEAHEEVAKHTHAIARLASGRELRFVDPRRFGRLSVATSAEFNATGIEPLEIEADRFVKLFRSRKTPIKSALLNQKLLRGVGNIYADESLFRAGIRPRRRASSIKRDQLVQLSNEVKEVLKEAIALGGSSVSDYVNAEGKEGFFQLQHRVYGREAEPCLVCKAPIKRLVIAGRSSHYCPKCQK
jgi:formamidopyrimidine-DNA glycosylase